MRKYRILTILILFILMTSAFLSYNYIFTDTESSDQSYTEKSQNDTDHYNKEKNDLNTSKDELKFDTPAVQCVNKVHITKTEFIHNQQCSHHVIKNGETLDDIFKEYSSTCPYNAYLKLIKAVNNISSTKNIKPGTDLSIPEITLKNGTIYKIQHGDTWHKICTEYYPEYDLESIMELLIYINDFNDDTLPLDVSIFLPRI